MMIKKKSDSLYAFALACFLLLPLAGCTEETEVPGIQASSGEPVRLSISPRAFNSGEEQVNSLRILQVSRTPARAVISNQFVASPAAMPLVVRGVSGTYDIYVVANETDNGSQLAALEAARNLTALEKIVLPYVASRTTTSIPMMGKVENVSISLPAATGDNAGVSINGVDQNKVLPVALTRLAVRIDLTVRSKSFAALQSVRFTGLPNGISLVGNNYDPAPAQKWFKTVPASDFTDVTPPATGYVSEKTKASIILPSYLFDPATEAGKAVQIEVYLDGKTTPFKAAIGHAAQSGSNPKDYTLHPNTHYTLTALIAGDDLTLDAQVKNWEAFPQDYPAGGGSFWKAQPQHTRVGLEGTTDDATATFFVELENSGSNVTFRWFRKKQEVDLAFSTEEIQTGITNTGNNRSELKLTATSLADAGEVYCVATITAEDGKTDRLESDRATFMVVGNITEAGSYPDMQDWKAPRNAPLGSTCLLRDTRDNKVYRVKLMADGNWWMIQDLAYGNVSTIADFKANCYDRGITNLINTNLYGVCTSSEISTGGHLYNSYAIAQIPEPSEDDAWNEVAISMTQHQSLCPDGWHLPGNMDNIYNKEWSKLQQAIGVSNVDIMKEFVKFGYNNPTHFGAYNLKVANPIKPFVGDHICFTGGFAIGIIAYDVFYGSLGFISVQNIGVVMNISQGLHEQMGVPTRCLRNFK